MIYLLFNEGYAAHAGDNLVRADLCREALRLGRLIAGTREVATPRSHALVALMALLATGLPAAAQAVEDSDVTPVLLPGDEADSQAARLEESTKTYGVPIILGERTAASCKALATIEIDRVPPRGKDRPERLYALLGDETIAADDRFTNLQATFAELAPAVAAKNAARAAELSITVRAIAWPGLDALLAALEKRVRA